MVKGLNDKRGKKSTKSAVAGSNGKDKWNVPSAASIVVATYNGLATLGKVLESLLSQSFHGKYEVIVVDDGGTDGTKQFLDEFSKGKQRLRVFHQQNAGVCRARNIGIGKAKYGIVINMDHDCIAEKDWLEKMLAGFDSPDIGVVSAYDYYGGTSTAFRKELLKKVGGYDEEYRYYREDTDLSFKVMELGYGFRLVKAGYLHDHMEARPQGSIGLLKYVLKRLEYHQNDVLLYKKHPNRTCEEFLGIRFGFLVDPARDFGIATGLWKKGNNFELSSPRGITFISNKTPLHALAIILLGVGYVVGVKASRLAASIRFGKLLI